MDKPPLTWLCANEASGSIVPTNDTKGRARSVCDVAVAAATSPLTAAPTSGSMTTIHASVWI